MCTVSGRSGWIGTRSGTARRPGIADPTTAASLSAEYCAFMVGIMVSRYIIDVRNPNVQQSPEKITENLNSLEFGLKRNFYVTVVALHHGLFIFKRALQSMGYEIIEMHGKKKQLVDFFTLSSGKRGYDVKFPLLDGVSLPLDCKEETLNNVVLANRDLLLSMGNFMKSKFFSCSSLFLNLFVDIQTLVKQKDQTQASFLSPMTDAKRSISKVRKPIDDLSDRSIKNNGKRVLEYVESLYGEEDAELYISAAYDRVVKQNRKNGTPELRILNYLEEEEAEKKYNEEVFVNDTRVANALKKIKNKNIVMSMEEKFQIISVFDAVKTILKELNITEIDRESAEATLKLIQGYNGICNISERSLLRLNDSRDIILKQRGRKVEKDFESEVWGNLMLCYYETNANMVSSF